MSGAIAAARAAPSGRVNSAVAMLGGSAAFGFGVDEDEAIPHYLEQTLNAIGAGEGSASNVVSFSVINLAFNSESAASFRPTLEDYRFLDYDLAILYEGYNDLLERPKSDGFRRGSLTFRWTGYLPVLPLVAREVLRMAISRRHRPGLS